MSDECRIRSPTFAQDAQPHLSSFVHKGENRVPIPLWQIIHTSGIDELVDQGLVEPLVFQELAFPTRAQDVPKLHGVAEAMPDAVLRSRAAVCEEPVCHCMALGAVWPVPRCC